MSSRTLISIMFVLLPSLYAPCISVAENDLPECKKTDRYDCNEECHGKFSDDFKICVSECMETRCIDAGTKADRDQKKEDEKIDCIEFESRGCDLDCRGNSGAQLNRCRRTCLTDKCPEASRNDIAAESLDPGTTRCSRCREKAQARCERSCSLGLWGSNSNLPGLEQLGCEKLCVTTECGTGCGTGLGF